MGGAGKRPRSDDARRAIVCALIVLVAGACATTTRHAGAVPSTVATNAARATRAPARPKSVRPVVHARLVAWNGPVEHLFFHTLVIHPNLAFTRTTIGQSFLDYFVTVGEFRAIIAQLYANGWTLVDIHRAVHGQVRVPPGRKPFVLSVDDVNYYDDARPLGVGWKLALDPHGNVKVEVHDAFGVRLTDDDIVPIVDEFVARHPAFSADGAKGILAVTGYEGVFGERLGDMASVARAKELATRLRATGWLIASHSYGHYDIAGGSVTRLVHDATEWKTKIERVVGPTDIFVWPYGSSLPLSSDKVQVLRVFGFTILCNIDDVARLTKGDGTTEMARRHIDGIAFRDQVKNLAPFFDVNTVEDRAARALGGLP